MRTVFMAVGLLSVPAATADQFDLICTAKNEAQHYRVDLISGEWCADDCGDVRKLADVASGVITLAKTDPTPPRNITAYNRINRKTGRWEWYHDDPRYTSFQDIDGSCEVAPFTGLGVTSRKF